MQRTQWNMTINFTTEKEISPELMEQFVRSAAPVSVWYNIFGPHHGCMTLSVTGFSAAAVSTRLQTLNDILDRILNDEIVFNKVVIECMGVQNES